MASRLALAAAAVTSAVAAPSWVCVPLNSSTLAPGAVWRQLNCTLPAPGVPFWGVFGPLVVNVIEADLSNPRLRLVPVAAAPAAQLQPLNAMAAADGRNLLAGINGGYFFRVDVSTFIDGVCQGKTRADALASPSWATPNAGVGDCASVAAGVALSSNCDEPGFSRPAILSINGTSSYISVLHRGDQPPAGLALDAVSAGPNLVTTNATGTFVDIPSDDDNIGARVRSRLVVRPRGLRARALKRTARAIPCTLTPPLPPPSPTPAQATSWSTLPTRPWGSLPTAPRTWSPWTARTAASH